MSAARTVPVYTDTTCTAVHAARLTWTGVAATDGHSWRPVWRRETRPR